MRGHNLIPSVIETARRETREERDYEQWKQRFQEENVREKYIEEKFLITNRYWEVRFN